MGRLGLALRGSICTRLSPPQEVKEKVYSSRFLPCARCGDSIERGNETAHECSPERLVEYQMFLLRDGIATFDTQLHHYLDSAVGRFEIWLAARRIRDGAG